jgi:hypothetical protein
MDEAKLADRVRAAWDDIDCGLLDSDELRGVLAKLGCDEEVDVDELWEILDFEAGEMGVVEFEGVRDWFVREHSCVDDDEVSAFLEDGSLDGSSDEEQGGVASPEPRQLEPEPEPEPELEVEPVAEPEPEPEPAPAPVLSRASSTQAGYLELEPEPEPQPQPQPAEGEPPQQSVWQWRGDSAPPKKAQDKWVTYNAAVTSALEQAFAAKTLENVPVDDERYVDLRHMLQRRGDNPDQKFRGVRRRQVLRWGRMEKKGGEDVWKLVNGKWELEMGRNYKKGGRRNWKEVWAVLYADGELVYYEKGPRKKKGEVLPSCSPDATLSLRSPTGENCSVDNGRQEAPDEFIVKLPRMPGKEDVRRSKTFRVKKPADRDEWKNLIMAEFGTSGTLPTWEDGSQMPPAGIVYSEGEIAGVVHVEVRPEQWRRGLVTKFCNDGFRAAANSEAVLAKALRESYLGKKARDLVGHTKHMIKFDDTGEEEEIELLREGNEKCAFKVAMNPSIVQASASEIGSIGAGSRHVALRWKIQDRFKHCDHNWDVQLRRQNEWTEGQQEWTSVMVKPPREDTELRSASLFDLGSLKDKPGAIFEAEWRPSQNSAVDGTDYDADYDWECIIRGLEPSTKYEARVRSVVFEHNAQRSARVSAAATQPEATLSSSGREIFGAWSDVSEVSTVSDAPPKHDAFEEQSEGRQYDAKGWWMKESVSDVKIDKGMGLPRRWFRVRKLPDCEDVEVLWRCKPSNEQQSWTSTVSIEMMSETDREGKRPYSDPFTQSNIDICGRVRIGAGENAVIECKPEDEAIAAAAMDYSYMCLKRHEMVLQTTPPEGRYVRIEHAFEPLSVIDISVFDASGERVIVQEAAMSSSFCTSDGRTFPASRMFDGSIATFCCTQGLDESRRLAWLRVDLGKPVAIGRVEILSRIDDGESSDYKQKNGLTDAIVSITRDRAGAAGVRVWESPPVPDGPKLFSYRWEHEHSPTAPKSSSPTSRRAREKSVASELYSSALEGEGGAGLEYPEADFQVLESLRDELFPTEDTPLPSDWVDLEGDGVLMPFSTTGERATTFRVRKQFTSKAKPFWVQLKGAPPGKIVDVVMKEGDDLRQDQVVLSMLEVFNGLWEEAGVMHNWDGGRELVQAPTYPVATVGTSNGFVGMLENSVPCDDIVEINSRGENGWKASPTIIPSSVAAFIVIFALNIKDRHKGNMVVTNDRLANIDFGWLEEGPFLDTGQFPIPIGLQYLLGYTNKWAEFHDLAWDAVKTLHENEDVICDRWRQILRHRGINDDFMADEVPKRIQSRVSIQRSVLDDRLREKSLATWTKNFFHGGKIKAAEKRKSMQQKPQSPAPPSTRSGKQKREPSPVDEILPVDATPFVEPEPEPPPEPVQHSPAPVVGTTPVAPSQPESVAEWLEIVKLQMCHAALAEVGYGDDIDMLIEGDEEEVKVIIAAVAGMEGVQNVPKVKKFLRELAKLRGKGETFSLPSSD